MNITAADITAADITASLLSGGDRRARKAHRCDRCGGCIPAGSVYWAAALVLHGDFIHIKWHTRC